MKRVGILALLVVLAWPAAVQAAEPPLIGNDEALAIARELSGIEAKQTVRFLASKHRQRGSRDFHAAAGYVLDQLRAYGFEDAEILTFPADGKTMYGTQKARPAWDADFAELWEVDANGARLRRLASWHDMPITLAQDSETGSADTTLVDVGAGTAEADYKGRDVKGKLVLASSQPGPVARLAVKKYGAAGIVSYAQNQKTAWWGEDENLVRWGHLDSFADFNSFAFMVSLKTARAFRERLARGEAVHLSARVRAGRFVGKYEVVTATIPGTDPALKNQEIAYSCHLDHQLPGANDNASGCATILEVARTLKTLIDGGRLTPPARTLRFIWPAEIEGTLALLNARPDIAARIRAVIHMDMVGGGPVTRAVFHVTRGPASHPTFVNDIAESIALFVNRETEKFAGGEQTPFALTSPQGGKQALQAVMAPFSMGSDHQVYSDSSFGVPSIYFNDWPDRYIHTNFDVPANIDPTKLKRVAFIGAASGYFLARMSPADAAAALGAVFTQSLRRTARMLERQRDAAPGEVVNMVRRHLEAENVILDSVRQFTGTDAELAGQIRGYYQQLGDWTATVDAAAAPPAGPVYARNPDIKGPLSVFGYNYLAVHLGKKEAGNLGLLSYKGRWGGGSEYAYEALNFVDGTRPLSDVQGRLAAEYGPVPRNLVAGYFKALEKIGIVKQVGCVNCSEK